MKRCVSAWVLVIEAHDRVWNDRTVSLRERVDVTQKLIRVAEYLYLLNSWAGSLMPGRG
jgi:hypothetical protein